MNESKHKRKAEKRYITEAPLREGNPGVHHFWRKQRSFLISNNSRLGIQGWGKMLQNPERITVREYNNDFRTWDSGVGQNAREF
jgi:hypothetical protein